MESDRSRSTSGVRRRPKVVHDLQLYGTSAALVESVSAYLADGLTASQGIVLMATDAHSRALVESLRSRSARTPRIVCVDAAKTLSEMMVDGRIDFARFKESVLPPLREAGLGEGEGPRVYGEMVDLLLRSGDRQAALELERHWNRLLGGGPSFSVLCACSMTRAASARLEHELLVEQHRAVRHEKETDERSRLMAEHSPAMLWLSDADASCSFFDESWLHFTGRRLEQERGDGWAEGVHPEDLAGCLRAYRDAFARREQFATEYRLRRADGAYQWVHHRGAPRFAANGEFTGYAGSVFDVTARLDARRAALEAREREILEASQALQRQFGQDLHDNLGQLLTGIAFLTQGLAEDAPPELSTRVQRLVTLVNEATARARRIAEGLAPVLRGGGLPEQLEDLARATAETFTLQCTLETRGDFSSLDDETKLHVFLIAQEAITNAVKHSGSRKIDVRLEREGERRMLTVRDEGRGLTGASGEAGLGLRGMNYRALMIGGKFEIRAAAGGGLEIRCTW